MSRLGVELVSLVDKLGHSVSGCDCKRCDDMDPNGCPCFSEMDELDMGNRCGPSCGCGLECENQLTQQGVSMRLKIVRDRWKGWGLYTVSGSFCEVCVLNLCLVAWNMKFLL